MINESIVDVIIKDQWKHANLAAQELKEIEFIGLGTFYVSARKASRKYKNLYDIYHNLKEGYPSSEPSIERARIQLTDLQKIKGYDKLKGYLGKQAPYTICDEEFGISEGNNRENSTTTSIDL